MDEIYIGLFLTAGVISGLLGWGSWFVLNLRFCYIVSIVWYKVTNWLWFQKQYVKHNFKWYIATHFESYIMKQLNRQYLIWLNFLQSNKTCWTAKKKIKKIQLFFNENSEESWMCVLTTFIGKQHPSSPIISVWAPIPPLSSALIFSSCFISVRSSRSEARLMLSLISFCLFESVTPQRRRVVSSDVPMVLAPPKGAPASATPVKT